MRLLFVLIIFLQVVFTVGQIRSSTAVSGYVGETVTLPCGANPSWYLSKIEWSVFSNNTWIATYRKGDTNTAWVDRYNGRLSLDITSGNLTIRNLSRGDSMDYRVDLISTDGHDTVNKVKLTVKQRLQKPIIQKVASPSGKGNCWLMLRCSSADKDVTLTWQVVPPSVHYVSTSDNDTRATILLTCLKNMQKDFQFTCTSSRDTENASRVFTEKYMDEKPQPQTQLPQFTTPASTLTTPSAQGRTRNREFIVFIGGFAGGLLTSLIFIFRDQIKKAFECLKGKLFQPKTSR